MYDLLHTVRIVDLTSIVAGPFATGLLGDLGAEVIKVEPPTGDAYRAAVPNRSDGMSAGYLNINRNKRSVVLDLKSSDGRQALDAIVATADVLIHNFRPSVVNRLDIGPDRLREVNPQLVTCTVVGYGSGGPYRDQPAYDDIVQARAGISSLLVDADGSPRLAPTVMADKISGLYASNAILAALVSRARTGHVATIEVPMFETMTSFVMAEHLSGELFQPPMGPPGYNRLTTPHRRPHQTKDGHVVLMPYTARHWESFLTLAGRADLAEQDWLSDANERAARSDELYELLGTLTPARTTDEWLVACAEADVPAAPVLSLSDVLVDEHLAAVDMFTVVDHPTEGPIRSVRHPVVYDSASQPNRPAPRLGHDTTQVLREVGVSQTLIDRIAST